MLGVKDTHKIGHGFELYSAGHPTRSTRFLHTLFVGVTQIPNGVAWMTEYPEVISAYIGKFLEIRFIYSRDVYRFNEPMRRDRRFWSLRRWWGLCQQKGSYEREEIAMGRWKTYELRIVGDWTIIREVFPNLPSALPGWRGRIGRR